MELKPRVLLVEDDADWLDIYISELQSEDYILESARVVGDAVSMLSERDFDVVVADLRMIGFKHDFGGFEVLQQAKRISPDILVIIITAYGSREIALEAMQQGAYDYITKPIDYEKFRWSIISAIRVRREKMQKKKRQLRMKPAEQLAEEAAFQNIIGNSKSMQQVFEMMGRVIDQSTTVLIYGESGTGKELIADALHFNSPRRDHPLHKIDCANLSEEVLSQGVFGYAPEEISGGTIFLDEVSALKLDLQDRLLGLIRDKSFRRPGEVKAVLLDVRIIAATNRDLERMVHAGTFRRSLYDCLNEFPVRVPPLRDRKDGDDILALAGHFLQRYGQERGTKLKFSQEALDLLTAYDYPGNVRELENVIRRAVLLAEGTEILPEYLPKQMRDRILSPEAMAGPIAEQAQPCPTPAALVQVGYGEREIAHIETELKKLDDVPPAIRQLANLIRARREAGDRPYTLLLGSSLSLTPEIRRAVCSSDDWEAFWTAMERLSAAERRALLASPLDGLNLTAGYRCLAQLVQDSYFDLILTLNVDDALDKALRILTPDEYRVFTHGEVPGTEIAAALGRAHPRVKVGKLHGDLNAYKLPLTPEGQFEFPKKLEEAVERLLSQDTILIGDISHDTDIQRCIRQGEGALWVVVPEEPRPGSFLYNAKKARPRGEVISGPGAEFASFFSALARELGMEGPKTSMPSPRGRKLIEFTFMPPEPDDYWDWLSAFRKITEEHRAGGSWTDYNDADSRINRLEDFLKPFCKGQVYGASFDLYSKDQHGRVYEKVVVIVKVKPERKLSFKVTKPIQVQKREELANIIRQEIDNLKGVRLISPASAQDVFIGDDTQVTEHFGAPLTEKVERGLSLADERAFLKQELAQHKRNLYMLREQAAVFAVGETPLRLLNQIKAEEEKIQRIEAELERLEK